MATRFLSGDRVSIESGDYAGKLGVIVPRRAIDYQETLRGAIPRVEGSHGPLGWHEMLVCLDSGKVVRVPAEHLAKRLDGEYPLIFRAA